MRASTSKLNIYGGRDPRDIPAYRFTDAARYLNIPLPTLRFDSSHPLAEHRFETYGKDVFVEMYGQLIDVGQGGQLAVRQLQEEHLTRVEHDSSGQAAKLYPFVRLNGMDQPRPVVINPFVSFGKPVIAGTGLPTRLVAERYKAGDSVTELARDYGRKEEETEDAIRYELRVA